MRRTLAAFCVSLGLMACGGTDDSTVDSTEAQALQHVEQEQQIRPPPVLPYCWNLGGTACSPLGATQNCTDGIWSDYVCTCKSYSSGTTQSRLWDCPEVR